MSPVTTILGDSREKLRELAESSVDACVTDPPYALEQMTKRYGSPSAKPCGYGKDGSFRRLSRGFMGMAWDTGSAAFDHAFWQEVLRVLKPGAHLLAFGGTRTYHRLACAIEDAGFEIRDAVMWHYGSGFPKSHNVSKAIDRAAGANGEFGAPKSASHAGWIERGRMRGDEGHDGYQRPWMQDEEAVDRNARQYLPATEAAKQWEGWGTALKPSTEIICLARKPLSEPTVAANVLRWGTGALNIGACRVSYQSEAERAAVNQRCGPNSRFSGKVEPRVSMAGAMRAHAVDDVTSPLGRWPTNLIHDGSEEVLAGFPESKAGIDSGGERGTGGIWSESSGVPCGPQYGDSGSAARFFYQAKPDAPQGRWPANLIHDGSEEALAGFPETGPASSGEFWRKATLNVESNVNIVRRREEIAGVGHGDSGSAARFFYTAKADADDRIGSKHPTIKPVDLMQYLVRLVCPRGGLVIDPFAGSGSTGEACIREGMRAILIEREPAYFADIERRIKLAMAGPDERAREIIKAQGKTETTDGLPLFGGAA